MSSINKVVLAYSGGLDTSVIVRWLQDTYGCEVVTFTADIGQGEEVSRRGQKLRPLGSKKSTSMIYVRSLFETLSFQCFEPIRSTKVSTY